MKRFLMRISYDGTNFNGWQSQKEVRTVQQTIEQVLTKIAKTKISTICAGRTDRGVHALRQYANFDFPLKMTTEQIRMALISNLPEDISILNVFRVKEDFNARYSAISRTYKYIITKNKTPFNRFYKSFIPNKNISLDRLKECLPFFLGKHDFTSFSKYNPDLNHCLCDVINFKVTEKNNDFIFEITANRFLHNMVRRIIGTIINISHTDVDPKIIQDLIKEKDQKNKLITTSPSQGLYLAEVVYPEEYFLT